jgi:hypothetical protein
MRLRSTSRWLGRGVAVAAAGVMATLGVSVANAESAQADGTPAVEVLEERESWEWD